MSRPTEMSGSSSTTSGGNWQDIYEGMGIDVNGDGKTGTTSTKSGTGSGSGKSSGSGSGSGGGGKVADEKKKTSYSQTIKGNKATANSHRRQARLLRRLAKSRREGMQNLRGQYQNATARNRKTRELEVADLLGGFKTAKEGYDRTTKDATGNLGTNVASSQLNRAREAQGAMAELSNMQAGETDRIKGMAASIRGMKANMDGGAADYASAITGVNNALGDLNSTVRTNINNSLRAEDSANASAFGEWTTGLQQGQSDLVDLYGQLGAEYESVADALATKTSKTNSTGTDHIKSTQTDTTIYKGTGGKKALGNANAAFDKAGDAADALADLQGRKYTGQALTIDQMNAKLGAGNGFTDAAMKANESNLDELANAGTLRKLAGPEGSKLRKVAV